MGGVTFSKPRPSLSMVTLLVGVVCSGGSIMHKSSLASDSLSENDTLKLKVVFRLSFDNGTFPIIWYRVTEDVGGVLGIGGGVLCVVGGVCNSMGGVCNSIGGVCNSMGGVCNSIGGVCNSMGGVCNSMGGVVGVV